MYFTSGQNRAFERLMQEKPGFDHYDGGGADAPERRRTAAPAAFIARIGNINSASMQSVPISRASSPVLQRGQIHCERS